MIEPTLKPFLRAHLFYTANGLLLRADLHKLFDAGYMTITIEHTIEISRKIKEIFENEKEYYKYHGKELLILPKKIVNHPNEQYINWHNENIYNG